MQQCSNSGAASRVAGLTAPIGVKKGQPERPLADFATGTRLRDRGVENADFERSFKVGNKVVKSVRRVSGQKCGKA
jgi:hypothetical protein